MLTRSYREHDLRLTYELDPGKQRLFTTTYACLSPQWEPFSRTQPWDSNVWLRPSGRHTWLNLVKASVQIFKILAGGVATYLSYSCQGKPHTLVPLLIKPATYLSGVVCLFLLSLLALPLQGTIFKPTKDIDFFSVIINYLGDLQYETQQFYSFAA